MYEKHVTIACNTQAHEHKSLIHCPSINVDICVQNYLTYYKSIYLTINLFISVHIVWSPYFISVITE